MCGERKEQSLNVFGRDNDTITVAFQKYYSDISVQEELDRVMMKSRKRFRSC